MPNMEKLRKDILSYSINDKATKDTIVNFYEKYKKIIEPHGAVGWAALQIYRDNYPENMNVKSITFETANPSKFPDEIISLIKITPEMPNSLKMIWDNKEFPNPKEIGNYQNFKNFLLEEFSKRGRISIVKYARNYKKIHKYVYNQILKLFKN